MNATDIAHSPHRSLSRLYTLAAHLVFLGGSILRSGEMVTVGSDGSVLVWDRYDGSLLADLPAATRPITTITASPDDAVLVTAGEDAVIRVSSRMNLIPWHNAEKGGGGGGGDRYLKTTRLYFLILTHFRP